MNRCSQIHTHQPDTIQSMHMVQARFHLWLTWYILTHISNSFYYYYFLFFFAHRYSSAASFCVCTLMSRKSDIGVSLRKWQQELKEETEKKEEKEGKIHLSTMISNNWLVPQLTAAPGFVSKSDSTQSPQCLSFHFEPLAEQCFHPLIETSLFLNHASSPNSDLVQLCNAKWVLWPLQLSFF